MLREKVVQEAYLHIQINVGLRCFRSMQEGTGLQILDTRFGAPDFAN